MRKIAAFPTLKFDSPSGFCYNRKKPPEESLAGKWGLEAGFVKKTSLRQLVTVGAVTAVTCVLAPISVVLPFSVVPVSLGFLAVYLSVYVLGWRWGLVSCALYLLLGLVGLPVFSGFSGGLAKLAGPTGGYLVGYLPMVLVAGLFIDYTRHKAWHAAGLLFGSLCAYGLGTLWLAHVQNITFGAALSVAVLPFLPWDLAKMAIALIVGPVLRKRLGR